MNNEMQLAERLKTLAARVSELERLEYGRFSGARVYNNANISVADSTTTDLTFNSERFDTDAYHSTGTNTERLTAPVAGKYLITGNVRFAANATGFRQAVLILNGSTTIAATRQLAAGASVQNIMVVTTVFELAAGDYVTLRVFQSSGGNLNVEAQTNYSPEFMIARLG